MTEGTFQEKQKKEKESLYCADQFFFFFFVYEIRQLILEETQNKKLFLARLSGLLVITSNFSINIFEHLPLKVVDTSLVM